MTIVSKIFGFLGGFICCWNETTPQEDAPSTPVWNTQVSDPIPVAHPRLKPDVYRVVPNWWRLSLVVPILFARPKRSHIRWKKMFFEVAGGKGLNGCFWCLLFLRDNKRKLYRSISCSLQIFTAQRMVWSCRCWVQFIDARVFLPLTPLNINMDLRFSPVWKVKNLQKSFILQFHVNFLGCFLDAFVYKPGPFNLHPLNRRRIPSRLRSTLDLWHRQGWKMCPVDVLLRYAA